MVDRAGFEPAALRSRVSAFPQTGSGSRTCQAGDLRPDMSVYQADLPAHRKTRPTQRLLNWFAHRVLPINCMLSQALLLTKQPGRGQTQPSEDHGGRIEHRLNTPQIIGDARKNSSYSNSAAQHQTVESHGRTSEFLCRLVPDICENGGYQT